MIGIPPSVGKGGDSMTNTDWAARLKQIVGCPLRGQRPFVCDGCPTECHVVIIGTNPATPLNSNWWEYGFDYNLFMCKYKAKRGKPGPTRRRLMRITACLREVLIEVCRNQRVPQRSEVGRTTLEIRHFRSPS